MREFGEPRTAGETRVDRPGSYAVVVDEQWRVAVVRVAGGVYLPGGGHEPDETPEQALHREIREETGLVVEVVACLGQARDWMDERQRFARLGTYFVCRRVGVAEGAEPEHVLEWWRGTRAIEELTLLSDRWITRRALGPC
jgi:8-oxo-dGTP diphosphatase